MTLSERFWNFTKQRPDGCWLWMGALFRDGYGAFRGPHGTVRAHRLAWELAHKKPVPVGLLVRHTCDVKKCVNPAHLLVGTDKDNYNDAVERGLIQRGPKPGLWRPISELPPSGLMTLFFWMAPDIPPSEWYWVDWISTDGRLAFRPQSRPTHWRRLPLPPVRVWESAAHTRSHTRGVTAALPRAPRRTQTHNDSAENANTGG